MINTNVTPSNRPATDAKSSGLPTAQKSAPAAPSVKVTWPEPGRIAERAYELYLQRDGQEGRALEDWLMAEQQLLAAVGDK